MDLNIDIAFDELVQAIKKLPEEKLSALKSVLSSSASAKNASEKEGFSDILLKGPVMSDDQYKLYKADRKQFSKWRGK